MKYLFLFDFDGVIVDSLELYKETTRRCFEVIGKPITKTHEEFLALFDENFYAAIQKRGVGMEEFGAAVLKIAPGMDYSTVAPFETLKPVLRELKKDNIIVIVSSNTAPAITSILSRVNWNGCFDEILGADFMLSKVDKIFHAMEKWHMPPGKTIFIGDTTGDIKEARHAGIVTVAVTWGWHSRDRLAGANPDYLIDTPQDLMTITSDTAAR
jgi:phosphoglycolate phosphatase